MKRQTRVTERLGIRYPIIQGPFGSRLSSVPLLAAVSNAGGLGSFGAQPLTAAEIETLVQEIRMKTDRPFNINLWVKDHDADGLSISRDMFDRTYETLRPFFEKLGLAKPEYPEYFGQKFGDQVEAVLRTAPPVFSFVYGIPDEAILQECRKRNIVTIGTAITLEEACALDEAGVDMIVASGLEAGGHRVAFLREPEDSLIGTMALVPQVVDHVSVPVIAAGGIADGRGINAAFALGAEAVQIGTAFLACAESGTSDLHKAQLFLPDAQHTALTRAFTGRLARGIENAMMRALHGKPYAPYPAQGWFAGQLNKAATEQGRSDLMAMWCGQAAPLLRHKSAHDLFHALASVFDEQ